MSAPASGAVHEDREGRAVGRPGPGGGLGGGLAGGAGRAELARSVLRLAEERTGAARWVRPVTRTAEPRARAVPEDAARAVPRVPEDPEAVARLLPVAPGLDALLPAGGLARGSTVVVDGSTSLVLALLAQASAEGAWVALVGLPDAGVLAAHQLGLALDRVALVPAPGADAPTVVAALLDGFDAVVVGPAAVLADADRRRLAARARERSAVLVPTTPWPGAHVVLDAAGAHWEGLGRGHGRLRSRRLTVRRTGRGGAAHGSVHEVVVPSCPHPWQDDASVATSVSGGDLVLLEDRRAG
ncbi:hypothetical protein [Cellulomonas carbonis]|uniref:hypothetical protein n=1 Tax=Cellulomonas carbonis TaxID=1386092 RepID=UPI0016655364|nr:hypothetical protein [Cellulomonas carbonis]